MISRLRCQQIAIRASLQAILVHFHRRTLPIDPRAGKVITKDQNRHDHSLDAMSMSLERS
jgi:hypothetical protein